MGADWSIAVGYLVYFVAIIVALIYYLRYKKWYLVTYIGAIATYIFAVFYSWDVFEFGKNEVLVLLLVSTILMVFLGKYFSKIQLVEDKVHTSLKEKKHKK